MRLYQLFFIFLFFLISQTASSIEIVVNEGAEGALPIAIVPFAWKNNNQPGKTDIAAVIRADLRRSGMFSPLAVNTLPARPNLDTPINYERWRGTSAENLVIGDITATSGDRYEVRFKMFDVYTKQQILAYRFSISKRNIRRVAHQISDMIYEKLIGVRGAFDTLIAYVIANNDLKRNKRTYTLAVAESDGFNEQIVLRSKQPIMSPAWSPSGKRLAYVSFEKGRSIIYIQELKTGKRKQVSSFKGINSAPRWSPDGKRLAISISKDGNAEVYILYINSGVLQRITNHYGIDTEPDWAPDGKSIVFTSDRGGKPQLYQINIGPRGRAGNPHRLTFEGNYNSRGSHSPDGNFITYITRENGSFRVASMNLKNGAIQILTQSRLDESPSFSPNGKLIIYATELRGRGVLEVVSVDGALSPQRLRVRSGDVRDPAWSGFRSKK